MTNTSQSHRERIIYGSVVLWTVAAVLIGHAIDLTDGTYDEPGLIWVAIGIIPAWMGVLFWRREWVGHRIAIGTCLGGVLWQLYAMDKGWLVPQWPAPLIFHVLIIPSFAISCVGAILLPRYSHTLFIPLLLTTYLVMGIWLLRSAPKPPIDVDVITQEACEALSARHNPYAIQPLDIYTRYPVFEKLVYADGLYANGRLLFGYPYMPLSLLVAWTGHSLGGDFRIGNLLAMAAAAGLLAYSGAGVMGAAAACLLLLTPRGYFVIDRGWSDPAVVLCLAAVVFTAKRFTTGLSCAVGLLMVSKQHILLSAPALWLLLPRPLRLKPTFLFLIKTAIAGAIITIPMVLWNFQAFWHSAVRVQFLIHFRIDSLNFAAAWARYHGSPPPEWIAFAIGIGAVGLGTWRAPRNAEGFAAAFAVTYLSFFAFSKQTFCNYYFLIIGALCCAIAAAGNEPMQMNLSTMGDG